MKDITITLPKREYDRLVAAESRLQKKEYRHRVWLFTTIKSDSDLHRDISISYSDEKTLPPMFKDFLEGYKKEIQRNLEEIKTEEELKINKKPWWIL